MDHKAFLSALPAETRAGLIRRTDAPALWRLALHLGSVLACGMWIAAGWPLWWAIVPMQGVLIAFLFTVEHEATHKTLLTSDRANDAIGHLVGVLILLPFSWFRSFHLAHHRFTNDPDKDPELIGGERPGTRADWAWHVSGLPYWTAEARVLWRLATGGPVEDFVPPNAAPKVRAEARWMLAGYAVVALSLLATPLLFWVWLLPVLIGQMALRIFLLSEHVDCPRVPNMFENTRTTFTTALFRLITWNASYHVEHHVYPQVPFHKLPDLHRLMQNELRVIADGYVAFTRDFLARHP